MKSIIVVLSLWLAVASAVNWDNVYPNYEIKEWREAFPKLAALSPTPTGKTYRDSSRIIGGQEATPNQFPYQVMVLSEYPTGWGACGGSVISANFILTAASCVDADAGVGNIVIIAGAHVWSDATEPTQQELPGYEVIMSPNYNAGTLESDIAIIFVDTFYYTDYVSRVTLVDSDAGDFVGSIGRVSGWGRTSDENPIISDVLNYVDVEIISNSACNDIYGLITDSQMCTTAATGGNICGGDAGGPLTVNGVQVGIVSFGAAVGCEMGYPSGYTRLTAYRDWVNEITGY